MEYHKITLKDKEWMDQVFHMEQKRACEFCFANNFLWKRIYPLEVGERHGCLSMRYLWDGRERYVYPCGGGDKYQVLLELRQEMKAAGQKLLLTGMDERDCRQLEQWFPGEFTMACDRDYSDYIYLRQDLTELKGKKYHGKRNHIARFQDRPWSYERLGSDNLEECRSMLEQWKARQAQRWNWRMEAEYQVVQDALTWYLPLKLAGALIRREGNIVAFCIGEPLNEDTFVVHFEKAFADVQGAYPMINQQFAERECGDYQYINREEDDGEEGLRKAKMSYHPIWLQEKFTAVEK